MQQTPPLASISHSTPAARTPQTQRQHHTKGEEEERVSELEREGVSSPPIISFLSFGKKRKKRKFPAFFPPPLLFYAINLIPCKKQKRKEKKRRNAPKDFSPVFFLMQFKIRLERRWQEKRGEDKQPPLPEGGMMLFFLRRERLQMCCGAPPYILPIPPSIPCLSTAHVTSPCCHGYGSTCCRQEEEEERKRSWGQESKKGMKRKGGKTKRGLKKKTSRTGRMRAGGKGKGRGCKERRRGNKGEKSRTFLFTSHSDSCCFLKSCFPSIKLKLFCRCGDIGLLSGNKWKYLQAHQSSAAKKLLLDSRKFRRLKISL